MRAFLVCLAIYAGIATWTAGAMNATERANWHNYALLCSEDAFYVAHHSRNEFVFSIITGLIPPGWIAAILITGAYQDGWTLKTGPACDANGLL